MSKIPEKSRAILLSEYNNNLVRAILGLKVAEISIRKLRESEVLIKTEAAPCNPSDIAFIRGGYNVIRDLPAVPGFEGTGVVIDTGIRATKYLGKRVSAFAQDSSGGTWAEYFIASTKDCIVIKENLDTERAACLAINPFTAWAMVEIAEKNNHRSIAQTGAGGQVASFVRVLAEEKGIEVINIVRKSDQIPVLNSSGAKYVLNSADKSFPEEFKNMANLLQTKIAFDAAGGELTAMLLAALPEFSEIVLYGGLAGSKVNGIDPSDIIFRNKKLSGFNLADWKKLKCQVDFEEISQQLQQMFIQNKLKTKIQGYFKLTGVADALKCYIKSMSSGKILFTP